METPDLLGAGGSALHPDFQWDGPARGVLAKVSGGVMPLGVSEELAAWAPSGSMSGILPCPDGRQHHSHSQAPWVGPSSWLSQQGPECI